jgi:hypothetical protein
MSDIFLSYAIEDREKAAKLAAVFERQHWAVWWDTYAITPGADYANVMAKELEGAKVTVVLWSRAARDSVFMREVLSHSRPTSLVTIVLGKVEVPPELRVLETFYFSASRVHEDAELQSLLRHLRGLIGTPSRRAMPRVSSGNRPLQKTRADSPTGKKSVNSAPEGGERFSGVFISYRRDEAAAYAGRLYDRLAARFGREKVFLDMENVGWGEDFVDIITAAAESCAVMIVLVSRGWARGAGEKTGADDYVRLEVATALGRKVRVIPILIQGAALPAPKELPEDLAPLVRRNALALSDSRWERDVEDLIKTLEGLLKD